MVLHDGETLVFEDWELVPTQIRVACECTINKLSAFSRYVGQEDVITGWHCECWLDTDFHFDSDLERCFDNDFWQWLWLWNWLWQWF